MKFTYNTREFDIKRYPATTNRSLQPWNAADELMCSMLNVHGSDSKMIALTNDRFGFLATLLADKNPLSIIDYKSQEKSLKMNLSINGLKINPKLRYTSLDTLPTIDIGLIKIPKSLDLFHLHLHQLHHALAKDGVLLCGFMTRHFTPQLLEIASQYFEDIVQSKAVKKARVLTLKGKKKVSEKDFIHTLLFNHKELKQYYGVFSSNNIDFATQYFIEHISVLPEEKIVLDLASGNGVIAHSILDKNELNEIHLLDDSFLAIKSSKLNLSNYSKVHFHHQDTLEAFEENYFDLIVSNPPFHFEYETNIEVAIELFKGVNRCLKLNGRFLMVASKHLNFKTHLDKLFTVCKITAENDKFVVYECQK